MSAFQDAIYEIAAAMRTVEGVKSAPNEPPENTDNFPFVSVLPGTGDYTHVAGQKRGLHDIPVDLYVDRKNSATDIRKATPFIDKIVDKIFSKQKAGTWSSFDTFAGVDYEFSPFQWGEQQLIGYRITIREVKIREEVS